MKRVLSVVVTALVAVSFAGLVCAAEHSPTDKVPADAQSPDAMKSAASSKKSTKKHKAHKKSKKGKKAAPGTTDMGSTPASTPTTGAPAGAAPGAAPANK